MLLYVGRYVKIHGLVAAKKHNGKAAIIKTVLDQESGRCGVRLVNEKATKLLSIKPINLTILCSFCKMREEKVICDRCHKTSYCSKECKKKHWDGANKESDVPNSHKAWCTPIKLEMEVPSQPIGETNVGDQAYEEVATYLQLAADIGNSGRMGEEREMVRRLLAVDKLQPAAWSNLFVSTSKLAVMAERYHPEEYENLANEAIDALLGAVHLVASDEVDGKMLDPDGPVVQMENGLIKIINVIAIDFLDTRMKGKRGKDNKELGRIATCLMGCQVLFKRRDEPLYKLNNSLGFCFQKLQQYQEAVEQFRQCCDDPSVDVFYYHAALGQIPQCMLSIALYDEDKSAADRLVVLNEAVLKFQEAIEVYKKDEQNPRGIPAHTSQAALARCLYNKNSLMNLFAQQGHITYSDEQKKECESMMNEVIKAAYQGASALRDQGSIMELQSLQQMPFP